MNTLIDYKKISDAKDFYESHGYKEIDVPWIIGFEAYASTKPNDREDFYVNGGYLNASGEQSFIDMMLKGEKLTKNLCITPCFRKEPKLDEIHQLYFVKLELIDTDVSVENLHQMLNLSKEFFEQYRGKKVKTLPMDNEGLMFDLIEETTGIELGSYGIRTYKDLRWIYGTGLALPRLDIVMKKLVENGK
jgi:thiol-disulfide isomerase/thioredoxin